MCVLPAEAGQGAGQVGIQGAAPGSRVGGWGGGGGRYGLGKGRAVQYTLHHSILVQIVEITNHTLHYLLGRVESVKGCTQPSLAIP